MAERLQKVMAEAGIASRRKSEVMITSGHVRVNGRAVTTLGVKVEPSDYVEVDGVPLMAEKPVYYVFYKPRGVVTTVHDEKGRKTVMDFFKDVPERIYPVGRLDYDTSGLLIMTNDGALANRLTHPKYEVKKTYLAKVEGVPTNADLKQLRLGVEIDGRTTAPAKSNLLDSDHKKNNALVQLTIHEGHNHQVKHMMAAIGHPVTKLKRERYGILDLQSLQPGEYRKLKPIEISKLKGER